ncbi:unnamed protein product, partial [Heterotrigona itama]
TMERWITRAHAEVEKRKGKMRGGGGCGTKGEEWRGNWKKYNWPRLCAFEALMAVWRVTSPLKREVDFTITTQPFRIRLGTLGDVANL